MKINKECLKHNELSLLKQLEERYNSIITNNNNRNLDINCDSLTMNLSGDKSDESTLNNDEQVPCCATNNTASISNSKTDNSTLKIKSNDMKLKISKTGVSDTIGLPCISEVLVLTLFYFFCFLNILLLKNFYNCRMIWQMFLAMTLL